MEHGQRESFRARGFLVVENALTATTVAALNSTFEEKLAADGCGPDVLAHYINREADHTSLSGQPLPRRLWHNDLIAPPAVELILRELCSSHEWGHMHPRCPVDKRGRFRLDVRTDCLFLAQPRVCPASAPSHLTRVFRCPASTTTRIILPLSTRVTVLTLTRTFPRQHIIIMPA